MGGGAAAGLRSENVLATRLEANPRDAGAVVPRGTDRSRECFSPKSKKEEASGGEK